MIKQNEQGRSMIEMLGVLAIAGILSVGGFNLVTKMQTSHEMNQIADEISDLSIKTKVVIRDYEGAVDTSMNSYLKNARAIPETIEYDETTSALSGKYETTYNVVYKGDGGSKVTFEISISNISEETCMQLVTSSWGTKSSSGFVKMTVGQTSSTGAMSIGDATTSCSDDATIVFSYK